jgi:hypothetical protein
MKINSYLRRGVFEPEATAAMSEAFEAACQDLHVTDRSNALCTLIAKSIVAAARGGELSPVRLRTAVAADWDVVRYAMREQ